MLNVIVFAQATTKLLQIQPLMRRALDGSIVKIEAVNIDDGATACFSQKKWAVLLEPPAGFSMEAGEL